MSDLGAKLTNQRDLPGHHQLELPCIFKDIIHLDQLDQHAELENYLDQIKLGLLASI